MKCDMFAVVRNSATIAQVASNKTTLVTVENEHQPNKKCS